ncbi:hypothetical protein [Nocardioides aquiterrae]|uniref:WD40 repeat domain-containing protein n=1 Tax=Nocardioides aquiterrae TaxID=203799 RepID=A0ABP4EQP9_9ACTN
MSLHRRALAVALAVATASTLAALGPAAAAGEGWSPLRKAGGHALAVALDDGTTALVSVGGPDTATVFDQRRTASGDLGPRTEITTVDDAEQCRPVEAATARGNVAVAVECYATTGLEDPPTRLAELVWTGDDGWVWHVQPEGDLGSLDYSPQGQYAVFTSNSRYGRAHHVTSYHADLGWRDLRRRQLGGYGDDLVAAIGDDGDVVAVRGAGFEDEPGYWFGGRMRLETYDAATGTWTRRLDRRYPDGGIDPMAVDLAEGRITATVVRSRSTGQLDGLDEKVVLLSGEPGSTRSWSTPHWKRGVLTAPAAITRAGVGVAAWQEVGHGRAVQPWFATWPSERERPRVWDLQGRTTLTTAATSGRTLDLAVGAAGHGAIAYVRHRRGAAHAEVAGASFRVDRRGRLHDLVETTWRRPVGSTVAVTAGATATAVTLGRVARTYYVPPRTRYSVLAPAPR